MSKYLCYKDTIKLVETSAPDKYGDVSPIVLTDLPCILTIGAGQSHSNHVDVINSDASAYIDYNNIEVSSRGYRLEGMYVIANPFNIAESESWYQITAVNIGIDVRCNQVENVQILLQKSEAL